MHYVVILNPIAGNGRVRRQQDALRQAFVDAGLSFEVWQTEAPGHALALARNVQGDGRAVVAVGGDGTVHEVARGVIENGVRVPLGVIPMGTGNDFVKTIGMPGDPVAAVAALARARPEQVDYGQVRWRESGSGVMQEQAFVNAVGAGFDAQVAHTVDAFRWLPGVTSYLAAVLRTLRCWSSPPVVVARVTDGGEEVPLYDGPLLLATVGNGVSSGGTFYLTPHASIRDGLLDACIVEHASPWRIIQILPRALRGRHESAPEVRTARVRRLRIRAEAPLPVHADGEMLSAGTQEIEVSVVEKGLRVLVPSPEES